MDASNPIEQNVYLDGDGNAVGLEVVRLHETKRSRVRNAAVSGAVTDHKEPVDSELASEILDPASPLTVGDLVLHKGEVCKSEQYLAQEQALAEAQAQESSPGEPV